MKEAYEILPEGKKIKHASLDGEFYEGNVINYLRSKNTTFTIVADKVKEFSLKKINFSPKLLISSPYKNCANLYLYFSENLKT